MKDFAKDFCLPPFGMLLASMQANPDMMRQAADMMSNMDPEQMSSMMASMQSGSGGPDPSAMAGLLRDPKSRQMMQQMMSNINAQQLAAMSQAAGQKLTPEQVHRAASEVPSVIALLLNPSDVKPCLTKITRVSIHPSGIPGLVV